MSAIRRAEADNGPVRMALPNLAAIKGALEAYPRSAEFVSRPTTGPHACFDRSRHGGGAPYEARRRAAARRGNITMNPSPSVIEIQGDDVTVEAGYLAARLGLSVARLRVEMRRGIVHSVVERGMGEDAGRLRLTFRYRARAWTMVVQRDGTLSEAP